MRPAVDPAEPPTAIAKPPVREADAYERRYMAGDGVVLFRAKRPAPTWLRRLTGGSVLLGLGLAITPAWLAAVVLLPAGLAAWALFSVLRVTVSEGNVSVQYGLFEATIPIASIERAEATAYDWRSFGGWGVRRSASGERMISMPGDRGRALRITWSDAGERRVTSVGMPDPEPAIAAIAAAIRTLRAAQ